MNFESQPERGKYMDPDFEFSSEFLRLEAEFMQEYIPAEERVSWFDSKENSDLLRKELKAVLVEFIQEQRSVILGKLRERIPLNFPGSKTID